MAYDLWMFPLATGVQEGLNPALLITGSLVLLGLLWFKNAGINRWWLWLFFVSLIFSTFTVNCGFVDGFILNKFVLIVLKCLHVIVAGYLIFKGIQFLKQWNALARGQSINAKEMASIKLSPLLLVFYLTLAGVLLSLLGSVWPVNHYILVFSLYMMTPGQLFPLGSLIFIYTLISFWFVYLMMWLCGLENRNQRLFKIVCAAIFMCSAVGIIEIILMKG